MSSNKSRPHHYTYITTRKRQEGAVLVLEWLWIFMPSCPHPSPSPPAENVRWFDLSFLLLSPFWNVRWAIKSQNTQLEVATSSKCKNGHLDFILKFVIFVRKKKTLCILCISALFFKNNLLPNKLRRFASSCEWKMSWLRTEMRKFATLFTSDWCFDG